MLGLALAGLTTLGLAACGPSELSQQYASYTAQVEPLLEQEAERWNALAQLVQSRQDDYSSPAYYGYLERTAAPFYGDLLDRVLAMHPEGEMLASAHAELTRFAEGRLEFVHVELSGRELFASASGPEGLAAVMSGLQEAEGLRIRYMQAIGTDVPDAKLGELYALVDTFRRKYFQPLQAGAKDPDEVRLRLTSHVIPALETLKGRKYFDDEPSRILKDCVTAWLEWHKRLARTCPTLQQVWEIKSRSEAAARESEEALAAFKRTLEEVRRAR